MTDRRLSYLLHHWYDVIVMVLPLLRPLRLLRLIPLLSILNRRARTRLRGRVAIYVVGGASLLAFVAALAVLDAERSSPEANIVDFGDAMWWAVTTMTTVGYGDRYPVTGVGRLVAFGLMVGGIALLGTVTATLASWLVEAVAAEKQDHWDVEDHGSAPLLSGLLQASRSGAPVGVSKKGVPSTTVMCLPGWTAVHEQHSASAGSPAGDRPFPLTSQPKSGSYCIQSA